METVVERLTTAIKEDLNSMRQSSGAGESVTIYHHVLPCNPKPYPISGLQHFFGTAFVALRLTEFFGLNEEKQATAFLAGLFHDYEKIGLKREDLMKGMGFVIGERSRLYMELLDYEESWNDAVEVASKLESGGIHRELQKVAELVRLGDYLTGGEESWNISYAMDLVKASLDRLEVEHHLVPVVIGRQRPIVALVAEELNEMFMEAKLTPLVSTPTGSLYLSRRPFNENDTKTVYGRLAEYISGKIVEAVAPSATGKPRTVSLKVIANLIDSLVHRGDNKEPNIGKVVSDLPTLRQFSINDINNVFRTYTAPADQIQLIIWSVLVYAKTLGSVKDNLRDALSKLGLKHIKGRGVRDVVTNLYNYLNNLDQQNLNSLAVSVKDKLVEEMQSVHVNVDDIKRVIERTVSVGYLSKTVEETVTGKEVVCGICREKVSKHIPMRVYLDRVTRVLAINVSELFHPDKQGRPENHGSLEGFSNSAPICPVCEYESIVFPATASFFDGMWASSIVYYPAMSIDLLQVVEDVVSNYVVVGSREAKGRRKGGGVKPLVIPDYIFSRVIVRTSDEQGCLRKNDLLAALDLWYFVGGNLVLTTNALSAPPPWSGLPIEMEVSDVVIEGSISKFMEELRTAKENNEWSRTRILRKILYEQLKTYILNLEESERRMGRTRFMKSGLITSDIPALNVYSFVERNVERKHL